MTDERESYVCQADGDAVFIRFGGETVGRFTGLGVGMLRELVRHPGCEFTGAQLCEGAAVRTAVDPAAAEEQCRHMMQCVTGMDAMLEQLRAAGTPEAAAQIEEVEKQKASIMSQIEALKSSGDEQGPDPDTLVRDSLGEALGKIRKSHEGAAEHFEARVKLDATFLYDSPEGDEIHWVT
jgi:hypothetical protein